MDPKTKCQKCLEPTSFQVKTFECRGPLNACKWNRLVLSWRISNVKMPMPDATWSGNKNRTEYKAGNTAKGWFILGQYIGAFIVFPSNVALAPRKANFSWRISNVKMPMPDATWSGNKNRTEYKAGNTAKGWFILGQYIGAFIVFPSNVALAPRKANFF